LLLDVRVRRDPDRGEFLIAFPATPDRQSARLDAKVHAIDRRRPAMSRPTVVPVVAIMLAVCVVSGGAPVAAEGAGRGQEAGAGPDHAGPVAERRIVVHVTDDDGAPVADASVEALARDRSLTVARTGADGVARLSLAPGSPVAWIVALKPGAGLDYAGVDPIRAARGLRADEWSDEVLLTLRGARTVGIRAVDADGGPIAGVRFAPWAIRSTDRPHAVNLGASFIATATSAADGVARFDWIPRETWDEVDTTFLVQSPGYHWADPPDDVYPGEDDVEVTARLRPLTTITGRITLDERPPGGLAVVAEGRGDTVHPWRARARAGLDGRYTLAVAPAQTYTLTVVDDVWTATRTGVRVDDGPVGEVNLALTRAVSIHGRVARPDGTPVAGELVLLGVERGAGAPGDRLATGYWAKFASVGLQRWTFTDVAGRYAFRVGPGDHLVLAVGGSPGGIHEPRRVSVDASAPDDIRVDFESHAVGDAVATSAAPYRLMAGELFEYAFHPASRTAWRDDNGACMQCHRPRRERPGR
jgi:hypothetical protein